MAVEVVYASTARETANPFPVAALPGDLAIAHFDQPTGTEPVDKTPDWNSIALARDTNRGVATYWRTVDGTEPNNYDPEYLGVFRNAQLGGHRAGGDSVGDEPVSATAPAIPQVTTSLNNGYIWCSWRCEKSWTDVPGLDPPWTINAQDTEWGLVLQPSPSVGAYGGETFTTPSGSYNALVTVALESVSTSIPGIPNADFEDWPGRHVRTIDVARKLKAHGLDDTRHLDLAPFPPLNEPGVGQNLDFLVYSTDEAAWVPLAPFAYGDLFWDYELDNGGVEDIVGGGSVWDQIDPGAMFGPHYLCDEPADGQWRYTGADFRTGRIQVAVDFQVLSNNTSIEVALYHNDVLVYTRDGAFGGSQATGTVINWGIDAIIDITTDDVFDIRINSNNAVGLRFFQIQGQFWPKAAGEIAGTREEVIPT